MAQENDTIAYKVLTAEEFLQLQAGEFHGAAVDRADGYVHLSTAAQLAETVARHFAGQTGLIIAAVDIERLGAAIRWEVSRGGALFPHLYGRLTMDAVLAQAPLSHAPDGTISLPR
jgi:uncharacterized protein (DUF952 family)